MTQLNWEIPTTWTTGWTDVFDTGTWRSARPEHRRRPSPCHQACPVGGEIPRWVQLVKDGLYREAWLELVANNPLPAVTGRACHHPCEASCNRKQYDEPLAVRALERFLGDLALAESWTLPVPEQGHDCKVAVVGGGPAGLSCAYQLARAGCRVTVLEKRPALGGVLRWGIPEYRLPKDVVQREIQRLLDLGITARVGTAVAAADLANLRTEYDAVFLAPGAGRGRRLPQLEEGLSFVLDGLDFLERVNRGEPPALGREVAVIGGGSVAMDVARTARRLGAKVHVLALETREVLPAQREEVEEALAEGVVLYDGAMLVEAAAAGEAAELRCQRVELDPNVPPGVLKPIPLPGTEFRLRAEQVLLAIGQDPDLPGWEGVLPLDGPLLRVEGARTGRHGFYAGGDAASTRRFISAALGAGRQAARAILADLRGEALPAEEEPAVPFAEVNTFYFERRPRLVQHRERAAEGFRELVAAPVAEEARAEAARCFSCGHCVQCDNCYYFCPDMAVVRPLAPGEGYTVLEQYCKGCGLCVAECPRGAVVLKEERR